jgi:hypothetical protein
MGKRELVLISLFVVMGIVVYHFTAPPPPPGSEGVSFGGIIQKIRREVRGNRETASFETTKSLPVPASVRLVRLNMSGNNALTITGSDRSDIAVSMKLTGRGYTQEEAKAAAERTELKLEQAGDAIAVTIGWAARRDSRQAGYVVDGTIMIALPKRLLTRLEPHSGRLTITDVAGLEVLGQRGETRVANISGHVVLGHTGGKLEVEAVPSLKLTARNSNGTLRRVGGTLALDATGGRLQLEEIVGPLEIESRNVELTVDAAKLAKPPFRYNGTGGQLRVSNLRTESRFDGRNVELEVVMTGAAPVTIYSTGEDIVMIPPPGGYSLDAVATDGQITAADSNITATPGNGPEARVTADIRGGGPTLTLRVTRGRIDLRKPAGK